MAAIRDHLQFRDEADELLDVVCAHTSLIPDLARIVLAYTEPTREELLAKYRTYAFDNDKMKRAVLDLLNPDCSTTSLKLNWSKTISDLAPLAEALRHNATLTTLFLYSNRISDADKSMIRDAWRDRGCLLI